MEDAESVFAIDDVCEEDVISWYSAVLVIGDTVSLRIKFSPLTDSALDGAVIKVDFADDTHLVFTADDLVMGNDGYLYFEITDIPASRYDTEFTVALYAEDAVASDILHYSVATYVHNMKDHPRTGSYVKELYEGAQA